MTTIVNRKADFFNKTNRLESIRITNRMEYIRIANGNALVAAWWWLSPGGNTKCRRTRIFTCRSARSVRTKAPRRPPQMQWSVPPPSFLGGGAKRRTGPKSKTLCSRVARALRQQVGNRNSKRSGSFCKLYHIVTVTEFLYCAPCRETKSRQSLVPTFLFVSHKIFSMRLLCVPSPGGEYISMGVRKDR